MKNPRVVGLEGFHPDFARRPRRPGSVLLRRQGVELCETEGAVETPKGWRTQESGLPKESYKG